MGLSRDILLCPISYHKNAIVGIVQLTFSREFLWLLKVFRRLGLPSRTILKTCHSFIHSTQVHNKLYSVKNETQNEHNVYYGASKNNLELSLQHGIKLCANPSNPAYKCVFHSLNEELFHYKSKLVPPLGIRMKPHNIDANIDLDITSSYRFLSTPPWLLIRPEVDLSLTKFKNLTKNQILYSAKKKRNNSKKVNI